MGVNALPAKFVGQQHPELEVPGNRGVICFGVLAQLSSMLCPWSPLQQLQKQVCLVRALVLNRIDLTTNEPQPRIHLLYVLKLDCDPVMNSCISRKHKAALSATQQH